MKVELTHLFITNFGWEPTIYNQEDFKTIELLGRNDKDGEVFIAIQENDVTQILKGKTIER